MSKTQVTSVGAFSDSHTFDLQSFRGSYRPHYIFLREHRSKGNEERKPYSVYSKRSQYHDERNMKDFPVFWDGSYLYQFLVAIWRSYKMLWLVGRKITYCQRIIDYSNDVCWQRPKYLHLFHGSLKVSAQTLPVKYLRLTGKPWEFIMNALDCS